MTAPTMQSVAKLLHLLLYLIGTKMCVMRLRPSYQLSDGNCSLDVNVYVDSDWAGCSKTGKSTSGSTVNGKVGKETLCANASLGVVGLKVHAEGLKCMSF